MFQDLAEHVSMINHRDIPKSMEGIKNILVGFEMILTENEASNDTLFEIRTLASTSKEYTKYLLTTEEYDEKLLTSLIEVADKIITRTDHLKEFDYNFCESDEDEEEEEEE